MLPQDIIRKKRDKQALSAEEIRAFVLAATKDDVSEGQIGAFTMAVFLNGMSIEETVALSLAMRDSGRVVDWGPTGLDQRRIIDKHSSGGVGDEKITLIVVPLAAACGVHVPNLSGRGLDYCAGEVDMFEAVPGYDFEPPPEKLAQVVKEAGCAIIGPTLDLAPADRKIFYVRDVTATVESVPLITGSILSKKLASAPSGLVITVGSGSGAYMDNLDEARVLATSMSEVAAGAGVASVMLMTDLESVLGTAVGNAVGVAETVDFLTGKYRDRRVEELVLTIVAEMVRLAGIENDLAKARALAKARLDDGSGARKFGLMVAALGGPKDFVDKPAAYLPKAAVVKPVIGGAGFVTGMDAEAIGLTLVELGGGRKRPDEVIDLAVGLTDFAQIGDRVGPDRPICTIHAKDEASFERAAARVVAAVRLSQTPVPAAGPIVLDRLERHPSRNKAR
jgi:thymidine phosphorylase